MKFQEFIPFIKLLASESSQIIKSYFRSDFLVETKVDLSPVTIADKLAEEKMRSLIMMQYPEHGIIGEEFGNENPDAEYVWVLDPIDGTKSFISGALSFGTLIGLMKNGEPVLGVINHPILNEFLIGDNETALLNDKQVKIKTVNKLSEATLLTTDHLNIKKYQNYQKFEELVSQVKLYRNWGDCYGYYLLSTGYADIMIDPIMSVWDTMALIPIVRGAGGIITDFQGNDPANGNSIVASSPGLHAKVISFLS